MKKRVPVREVLREAMGHSVESAEELHALREADREKTQARKSKTIVRSRTAERREIDFCEQCPFADMSQLTCRHESAPDSKLSQDGEPPPQWCPIRGKVVLIGGPK
jgi:hypothetical protein